MKRYLILIAMLVLSASAYAQSYCDSYEGALDDGTFYQNMELGGRQVSVYKTDSSLPLCAYENFCERKGMNWYAPHCSAEADSTLTAIREIDDYHTWIISMAPTTLRGSGAATWNGQALSSVDGSGCVAGSSDGFSAIRDWACSMCNPEDHGTTRCWDSGHEYDWILCEGEYVPPESGSEVPEFTAIGAGLAILGAGIISFKRSRK